MPLVSPYFFRNWLLVWICPELGIGYYGRPVNTQDSTQAFVTKYHISHFALKIVILLRLDMLDDFQAGLS